MRTFIAACIALLALPAAADDYADVRERLASKIPGVELGEIRPIEGSAFLEVQANGRDVIYTDREANVAIHGNLIELQTRTNLTEKRKQELQWVEFAALPLDKAFIKVKGDGSRKLAVFTDPDCPYCKRLEDELDHVDNATIYFFLYPLAALHPDASRKARLVWCAQDRGAAWDGLMRQNVEPPAAGQDCTDPIADIAGAARRLGIQGTPGLIFGSGRLVPGLVPRDKLEEYLTETGRSPS